MMSGLWHWFAAYVARVIGNQKVQLGVLFGGSDALAIDRANYLRSRMPIAMLGSPGTGCALFFLLDEGTHTRLMLGWLALSVLPLLMRLVSTLGSPRVFSSDQAPQAHHFLHWYAIATLFSGLQYGLGWLVLAPVLSIEGQYVYLMAIIALLFGGLHTYSPHFISYLAYSSAAMGGALIVSSLIMPLKIAHSNVLIALVYLLSTMFAMDFSLSFFRNVELKRTEEALLDEITRKHAEAVAADAAKSRFLAAVSHDLRQPMHAVSLYVATISRMLDLQRAQLPGALLLKEQIGHLSSSVGYLTEMFEALLDMSRLEAGTANIDIAPVRLQPMLDRLVQEHAVIASKMSLSFSVRSSVSASCTVRADDKALERLLRNLISNALRHTQKGGVRLALRARRGGVDLRVIDSGIGIARFHHDTIFQEFTQIVGAESRRELGHLFGNSFGLGLAIVYRLAKRMQTNVRVHSWPGVGSVFSIWLPLADAVSTGDREWLPPSIPAVAGQMMLGGVLVVLIDDNDTILESTRRHLELYGAEVVAAPDTVSALAKVANLSSVPDVVVSDYRLYSETGIDAIHALREEFNCDIPALIVTGETSAEHLQIIAQTGFEVLFKPLQSDALVAAIRAAVQEKQEEEKRLYE